MATEIPAKLKDDLPPTTFGKVLGATPVVMTVIATGLAGLSSSEMNRAQYDRSWAAQLQSKASDQWSFFQAKRLRSLLQGDVADLMVTTRGDSVDGSPARRFTFKTQSSVGEMPDNIQKAIQAIAASRSDETLDQMVSTITETQLEDARKAAAQRLQAFDAEQQSFNSGHMGVNDRLRFAAARYDAESRLDQDVANIYELLVRKSNISARRHHERSQQFFLGMLVAQMAVVISTFALATRRRNILWSIGAVAGVAAVSFAVYVYLWT